MFDCMNAKTERNILFRRYKCEANGGSRWKTKKVSSTCSCVSFRRTNLGKSFVWRIFPLCFSVYERKTFQTKYVFGINTANRVKGESKFEIRTLSVDPMLRGRQVDPLTIRIAFSFCLVPGQNVMI